MKTIFKLNMLLLFAGMILFSCKKDESKIYFQGGTAPVLSVSDSSALVLTHDNAAQTAVTFSWTNPDYMFNTGVSSMNVTYLLQVDTAGSNFSSPQEVSISSDLSKTFTEKDLNTILTKLNLQEDVPHSVEFRIKSSLVNNTVPLYSNVISLVITPYLDVAVPIPPTGELYITGDATPKGWINGPAGDLKMCDKISNTEYSIVVHLKPGFYYKFLSTPGQWQPQYGGSSATGGDIGYNFGLPGQSDPAAIPTPSEEGDYKVDLNFKTGKYTVTKQ